MTHETAGTQIAYSGRVTNWGYLPFGIGVAVFYVLLQGRYTLWSIIGPFLFITLPLQIFTSMRTIAGPKGVVARYGFGVRRLRYPAAMIERADVIDPPNDREVIRFWRQEFWRRHTIDSGPYLRLHLADGRRVLLTAPDPHAAASVVNAYAGNAPGDRGLDAEWRPRRRWWRPKHSPS